MKWWYWVLIMLAVFYFWMFPLDKLEGFFIVTNGILGYLVLWTWHTNKDLTELKAMIQKQKE
jgi:hypothetical protein